MKLLKKIYDWTLKWAQTPYAVAAVFIIAVAESSFFPVPPDVLLIACCIAKSEKSFYYATICTIGSIVGGILGYLIGFTIWQVVKDFFFTYIFSQDVFFKVQNLYQKNAFWAVFTAGFTPIPYKVFTIAGGVCEIGLGVLIVASIFSRGARFFLVAGFIWKFGKPIESFINKYFNLLTIVFTILLIAGFIVVKYLIR